MKSKHGKIVHRNFYKSFYGLFNAIYFFYFIIFLRINSYKMSRNLWMIPVISFKIVRQKSFILDHKQDLIHYDGTQVLHKYF